MGATQFRRELGQQLRVDSVRASAAAGSGHPTSSISAADLIAVLLDGHLRLDLEHPDDPRRDHVIFSKGHASPLYYSMLKAAGGIDDAELLTFRKLHSRLEGHPTPATPPTDVATGSLGQGLPIGVGVALTGRRLDRLDYRVWVLCGDSEMAEGSMWEPSSTPPGSTWTTSSRSSTSTGSARPARRCWAGTSTATPRA
jgi:transketolase